MIPVGWADDGAAVVGGGPEVVGLDGIMYGRPVENVIRGKIRDVESNRIYLEVDKVTNGIEAEDERKGGKSENGIRKAYLERYRGTEDCERERGSVLDGRARAVSSGDHGLFYGGRGGAFGCTDELHVHQP